MENKAKEKGKGLSTNQKIMIGGFAVLIVVVAVAGYLIYQKLNQNTIPAAGGNLIVDENNLGDIDDLLTESVEDGMFEVNMSTTWLFPDGKSAASDAYLANGAANRYPLTFEIVLNEETIFSSSVIPVGKQIKDIILDKALAAGTYDAVCMYHLWKEDGTENSSFGVGIKLVVEN